MNYRSKKHLLLCRDQACYLQFDGCTGEPTAAAHSNALSDGKGVGLKASDHRTLPACLVCHQQLDHGGKMTREDKREAFDRAWLRWQHDCWTRGYFKVEA